MGEADNETLVGIAVVMGCSVDSSSNDSSSDIGRAEENLRMDQVDAVVLMDENGDREEDILDDNVLNLEQPAGLWKSPLFWLLQ